MSSGPLRHRASAGGWLDIPRDWIASLGDIIGFSGRAFGDIFNGRVFRFFPSLTALDSLGRRGIAIGFPALTLALVLAWAWTVSFQRSLATENPQVIWGIVTWVTFVVLLAVRHSRRPGTERRAAFANVLGFLFVVVCYVLLRMFMAGGQVFL